MSKETAKRVTLEQLIARKVQREKDRLRVKYIYVPSLDATMLFKKINDDAVLDAMEEIEGGGKKSIMQAYGKLIYLCCEDLHNAELHKEIGAIDPFTTVDILFSLNEIMSIGVELMELLDLDGVSQQVKN